MKKTSSTKSQTLYYTILYMRPVGLGQVEKKKLITIIKLKTFISSY